MVTRADAAEWIGESMHLLRLRAGSDAAAVAGRALPEPAAMRTCLLVLWHTAASVLHTDIAACRYTAGVARTLLVRTLCILTTASTTSQTQAMRARLRYIQRRAHVLSAQQQQTHTPLRFVLAGVLAAASALYTVSIVADDQYAPQLAPVMGAIGLPPSDVKLRHAVRTLVLDIGAALDWPWVDAVEPSADTTAGDQVEESVCGRVCAVRSFSTRPSSPPPAPRATMPCRRPSAACAVHGRCSA